MAGDKKKILVAEDNRVMSDVIRFNLEQAGFDVTVASNGRRAADLMETGQFDLLITDYQMPEMSGEELCRHIRQDQQHADVPILLCSAKGYELDLTQLAEELKIAKVLFKPFSPTELVDFVRSTLVDQRMPA